MCSFPGLERSPILYNKKIYLSRAIHIQILQTDLYLFLYRIS